MIGFTGVTWASIFYLELQDLQITLQNGILGK